MKLHQWLIPVLVLLLPGFAEAQTIPLVTSSPMDNGTTEYALGIQILMVMTVLTLLPAMLITMTAFTRILIVLAILRQALGTAQTPSNQIILGLSLFLTLFIMSPVIDLVWIQSLAPYLDGEVGFEEALGTAQVPLRVYVLSNERVRIWLCSLSWADIPRLHRAKTSCLYCSLLF